MSNYKNEKSIINQSFDQIISDRFGRYSKYIIQGRALPDARDGLKPVQRRILFSMSELGLWNNKSFKKSARIVGDVIGKYHPHGDSSIYEAMVRMSQPWKMNIPLIEMHGNNGSIDDDPAAAMRYTETRLEKIAESMLKGIKKNTVSFVPNFDDSEKEPTVLPGLVPNLLVNGARGIAAGYATEMPPHNLGEVVDAIIFKIKSPNAKLNTLLKFIQGPDFPTGGIVKGSEGIYQAFERGAGKIAICSKFQLNTSKNKPSITITELPYQVIKSKLVREIDNIKFNKKIARIKDVRDESDRNGVSIFIELFPTTDAKIIAKYLMQKTDMQKYYSYNNVAIKDLTPKQMGLIELIDTYLTHQKKVLKNAIKFDLTNDEKRFEIIEGLIKVTLVTKQIIEVIRKVEGSKMGVVKILKKQFHFTELQANAIADLKLYRLSKTDQSIYLEEKKELYQKIKNAKEKLASPSKFNNYLVSLLKEIKTKFSRARKTQIIDKMEKLEVNIEKLIKHKDVWIGISRQGYIKRFSNKVYEMNELQNYVLKEEDTLIYLQKNNTIDKLLIFTNKGKYVFIPIHLINENKWKDVGKHINDFATLSFGEKIVDAVAINDFNLNAYLILVTTRGKIKRIKINQLKVSHHSKPLIAIKLAIHDYLVGVKPSNGFNQVILVTNSGKAVKYSETEVSIYGPKSSGIKGMEIPQKNIVTSFVVANNEDVIGIISKRGGAKRIKVSQITPMSKKTQGKALFKIIKGNPHLALDMAVVSPADFGTFKNNTKLQFFQFNKVDITTSQEGFSRIGSSQTIDGKILVFNRIYKESCLFNSKSLINNDDKFKNAEKIINQLSIDDILKDL